MPAELASNTLQIQDNHGKPVSMNRRGYLLRLAGAGWGLAGLSTADAVRNIVTFGAKQEELRTRLQERNKRVRPGQEGISDIHANVNQFNNEVNSSLGFVSRDGLGMLAGIATAYAAETIYSAGQTELPQQKQQQINH